MANIRLKKYSAMSVIELVVAMVILTILMGLAVPGFRTIIENNRASSYGNDFLSALRYARNAAIKYRDTVSVCAANTSRSGCSPTATWEEGWIIFVDDNGDGNRAGSDTLLRVHDALKGDVNISPAAAYAISFASDGFLTRGNGIYQIVPDGCSGTLGARQIQLFNTGRTEQTKISCN